jgi:predicted nuclease with TOPRIM domain
MVRAIGLKGATSSFFIRVIRRKIRYLSKQAEQIGTILTMIKELDLLQDRITSVSTTLQRLRTENKNLRESLLSSEEKNRQLQSRIDQASERLENLLKTKA